MVSDSTDKLTPSTDESRGAETIALQDWLLATYPTLFDADAPLPLKVGVHHDILTRHPELDPAILKRALKRHCHRRKYQIALAKEGAYRVDLDGNLTDEVKPSERTFAQAKLRARNKPKVTKPSKAEPVPAQAAPPPTPAPTPPAPTPPLVPPGRPILRLKKPASPVVAASVVTRKEGKP